MEIYKLKFSVKAYEDLVDIYDYTNDILKNPEGAKKVYKKIKDAIKKLEFLPKRYPLIKVGEILYNLRLFIIDDYIVFYMVADDEKIVRVERILHGASDWSKQL